MKKNDQLAEEIKKLRHVMTLILAVLLLHLGGSMGGGGIAAAISLTGFAILAIAALKILGVVFRWIAQIINDEPEPASTDDEDWELAPASDKS